MHVYSFYFYQEVLVYVLLTNFGEMMKWNYQAIMQNSSFQGRTDWTNGFL